MQILGIQTQFPWMILGSRSNHLMHCTLGSSRASDLCSNVQRLFDALVTVTAFWVCSRKKTSSKSFHRSLKKDRDSRRSQDRGLSKSHSSKWLYIPWLHWKVVTKGFCTAECPKCATKLSICCQDKFSQIKIGNFIRHADEWIKRSTVKMISWGVSMFLGKLIILWTKDPPLFCLKFATIVVFIHTFGSG